MKKLLLALAACCFLFACDKNEKQPEEPTEAPELTLTSESEVNVSAEGGEVTITYTLANPAEGGEISASAAEGGDWCDGFNCDTDGQVTFTVAANEGDARETVVTVTYTYGESEHKDITVTVKQVALGDPLFELTSESEVAVSKDGEDVTVTYSITDPREDGAVSVNVPEGVDWISNVNTDTDGQVTFTVAANDGDAREAELTFVYTYGGSETQEFKVKVSQEGLPDPVLTLTSEAEVEVSGNGGNFTISYTLENPREDGDISVSSGEATWLDFNTDTDREIAVEVFANGESTARSAVVTVTYTYSEDKTVSFDVNLTQGVSYDYEFIGMPYFRGSYYADDYSVNDGEMLYELYIASGESYNWNGGYYTISIISSEPADMEAIAPAVGTYTMSPAANNGVTDMNTVVKGSDYTLGYIYPDASVGGYAERAIFSWGELELTYENGEYHIDAIFTDTKNKTHHITYTGPIVCEDLSQPEEPAVSLLTEDLDLTWVARINNQALYYQQEGRYFVEIVDQYSYNHVLKFELYVDSDKDPDTVDGLPTGTYVISDTKEAGTLLAGYLDGTTLQGSWIYPYGKNMNTGYVAGAGPLIDGTMTIEGDSESGFTCTMNASDDIGNTVSVTFTLMCNSYSFIYL